MTQEWNGQLVEQLATDFPRRTEPNYAWGNAISGFQLTPRLRGQWGVSCDERWYLFDHSGQGRVLTAAGSGNVPIPAQYGITPYVIFDAAHNTHYYRVDEPGLDVGLNTHGMSMWTWLRCDSSLAGNAVYLMGKWYDVGVNERSFLFLKHSADYFQAYVSSNGIAGQAIACPASDYIADEWLFLCMRLVSSTTLDIWVGNAITGILHKYTLDVGVIASTFDSPAPLAVGTQRGSGGGSSSYFEGYMSLFGLADIAINDQTVFTMFHQSRPLFMW